ncbi:MAG: RDD family protein [Actinomycetota bacterium]|nr:RDD family protein [Actinomycetota bacterium]MDA3015027.1 RDD family protein [Actinomycetota bacterium]MDA3027191.1 RDD family protein [Actinomycetota bacterium]
MSEFPPPPPPPAYSGSDVWATDSAGHAGFGARLGAYLLDVVLYGIVTVVVVVIAVVLGVAAFADCSLVDYSDGTSDIVCPDGSPSAALLLGAIAVGVIGVLGVALLYLIPLGRTGQTWGRRIVGIKVVRVGTGAAPGFWRAVGRQLFAGIISANVLYLGYLWMLWDSDRQTWHDKVSGTIVVRS